MTNSKSLFQIYVSLKARLEQRRTPVVFWVSAVCGAMVGLARSEWQVAVEPAQVIAGLVRYPLENPFYVYQVKTWTILHQIAALGLRVGLSEGILSLAFSALIGALVFAGIALWTLAFSESAPLALLSPFFVVVINVDWGMNYPLMLMDQSHTYGRVGLTFVFLTMALFGVGQYKWGALMLGLAPAFHPSLGAWTGLITLVCLAWGFQELRPRLPEMLRFGLVGGLVTLTSLIFHFTTTYYVPKIDPTLVGQYLSTFIRSWDEHRVPLDLFVLPMLIAMLTVVISLMGLQFLKPELPAHSHFLLRALVVSLTFGAGLPMINQLVVKLPDSLLVWMPTRLLNFNNLAYLPLVLGLMWRYRDRLWVQANLISILAITFFFAFSPDDQFYLTSEDQLRVFILSGVALVVALRRDALLSFLLIYMGLALAFGSAEQPPVLGATIVASFLVAGLIISVIHTQAEGRTFLKWLPLAFLGWNAFTFSTATYDMRGNIENLWNAGTLLTEAPKDDGLLLLGAGRELHLTQLRTRRPILLDPEALDMLPYAPEGGPEFERILREVYGINFFTDQGSSTMPIESTKALWESRTPEDWQRIRQEFNVTYIMTLTDWKLQLPEVPQETGNLLYQIP